MQLKTYVDQQYGLASELARALDVTPVLISQWANGVRPIPVERCTAIERATKRVVTRQDLRHDDWHLIWPELAEAEAAHA